MSIQPIKCASNEFTKDPFYLIQSNGPDRRYVVYLNQKIRIRTLLAGFINQSPEYVQIKIAERKSEEDKIMWFGLAKKSSLHHCMTEYEDVIFHYGFHYLNAPFFTNNVSGAYVGSARESTFW